MLQKYTYKYIFFQVDSSTLLVSNVSVMLDRRKDVARQQEILYMTFQNVFKNSYQDNTISIHRHTHSYSDSKCVSERLVLALANPKIETEMK